MEKKFIEKRNELVAECDALLTRAKTEERALTEEEEKAFAEAQTKIAGLDKTIAAEEQLRAVQNFKPKADETPREKNETPEEHQRSVEQAEEAAFDAYVRGVVLNRRDDPDPAPASYELTVEDNGAVIPRTIAKKIIKRVYDICPVLARSTKYNVRGQLEIPYYDESEQAITVAYKSEFQALTSSVGKFTSITLTGFLAGALSLVSRSLINNTDFNLTSFIVEQMAQAIARFVERELLQGTENKVEGLSTLTNVKATANAAKITADELIEVQGMVKDVYQKDAVWIMSPNTRTAIRQLKDGNDRYLLNDDAASAFGNTLLGKPVYVSDNMDDIGAGKRVIYYGDLSGLATKWSENINIEILRERYADMHAVGVIGWLEFDAKVEDGQKLACLQMKAS